MTNKSILLILLLVVVVAISGVAYYIIFGGADPNKVSFRICIEGQKCQTLTTPARVQTNKAEWDAYALADDKTLKYHINGNKTPIVDDGSKKININSKEVTWVLITH